jgi:hypothetical protein
MPDVVVVEGVYALRPQGMRHLRRRCDGLWVRPRLLTTPGPRSIWIKNILKRTIYLCDELNRRVASDIAASGVTVG